MSPEALAAGSAEDARRLVRIAGREEVAAREEMGPD